jgi:hypothetical protein
MLCSSYEQYYKFSVRESRTEGEHDNEKMNKKNCAWVKRVEKKSEGVEIENDEIPSH